MAPATSTASSARLDGVTMAVSMSGLSMSGVGSPPTTASTAHSWRCRSRTGASRITPSPPAALTTVEPGWLLRTKPYIVHPSVMTSGWPLSKSAVARSFGPALRRLSLSR
jgi:hypothetical protein